VKYLSFTSNNQETKNSIQYGVMENVTIHQIHNPMEIKGTSSLHLGEEKEAQGNVKF